MKNKNPLYVVNDNVVEEVSSFWQLIIKRFNLGPFVNALNELLHFIWMQIDRYSMVIAVKNFVDKILNLLGFILPNKLSVKA